MSILRNLTVGIAGLAGLAGPAIDAHAQQGGATITCTNVVSGASWRIRIDYGRATVDDNSAKITDTAISWFDPKDGGNYTLDRKTGALTASVASSTGGYFRHGRCGPENSP